MESHREAVRKLEGELERTLENIKNKTFVLENLNQLSERYDDDRQLTRQQSIIKQNLSTRGELDSKIDKLNLLREEEFLKSLNLSHQILELKETISINTVYFK